jgi:hypothetical protein
MGMGLNGDKKVTVTISPRSSKKVTVTFSPRSSKKVTVTFLTLTG